MTIQKTECPDIGVLAVTANGDYGASVTGFSICKMADIQQKTAEFCSLYETVCLGENILTRVCWNPLDDISEAEILFYLDLGWTCDHVRYVLQEEELIPRRPFQDPAHPVAWRVVHVGYTTFDVEVLARVVIRAEDPWIILQNDAV